MSIESCRRPPGLPAGLPFGVPAEQVHRRAPHGKPIPISLDRGWCGCGRRASTISCAIAKSAEVGTASKSARRAHTAGRTRTRWMFRSAAADCGFSPATIVAADKSLKLRRRHAALYTLLVELFGAYGCHPSQESIANPFGASDTFTSIDQDGHELSFAELLAARP